MHHLNESDIQETARRFCRYLGINNLTPGNFAQFLEQLSRYKICIDPVDDGEWPWFVEATCDPREFHIMLPNSTYEEACRGDHAAISTLFHEIGHIILGHRALLHKAGSAPPTREEDAEWQADEFAACVARRMKIVPWQLSFDFGGDK
ncbi:ImmA/IrrE family metallo-endopeptidase [Ralstonia sp. UBA689]|uniref:ImmA/IrrE family metallo-endopeptidase n=1 Tax=Ralstonia sp. UBA689 TaxID=1947373 RepID=UPI0025DA933E|nr:ImmA/IrrE family metallo-endopeptidase [Ralstonia sp. UBA689]